MQSFYMLPAWRGSRKIHTCSPAPQAPKGVQNFAGLILFACIFLYGFEILMRDLSLEIKTLIERIFL